MISFSEDGFYNQTLKFTFKKQNICGDGIKRIADLEECDDLNKANGDGCSAECKVEANYTCRTEWINGK